MNIEIQLEVRHAAKLRIRNVGWLIADRPTANVILGREVLAIMGLVNETLLNAAYDKFNGVFDASHNKNAQNGSICSLVSSADNMSTFHSSGNDEGHEEPEEMYLDIGENTDEEVREALDNRVSEARQAGLSVKGAERLRKLLETNRQIFRLKLGNDPPAKVSPMEIRLKHGSKAVRVKARSYPTGQRQFLNNYRFNWHGGFCCHANWRSFLQSVM